MLTGLVNTTLLYVHLHVYEYHFFKDVAFTTDFTAVFFVGNNVRIRRRIRIVYLLVYTAIFWFFVCISVKSDLLQERCGTYCARSITRIRWLRYVIDYTSIGRVNVNAATVTLRILLTKKRCARIRALHGIVRLYMLLLIVNIPYKVITAYNT
jgi:hypothetical protein